MSKIFAYTLFGQIWYFVITFSFIPIYLYFLGVEAYGLISIFTIVQSWILLLNLGLSPTLAKEMSKFKISQINDIEAKKFIRSVEVTFLWICVFISIIIFIFSENIKAVLITDSLIPDQAISNAIIIMGIVSSLRLFESIYHSALIGLEKQINLNIVNSVMHTVRAVGSVVVLIIYPPSVVNFFIWQGLCSLCNTLILYKMVYSNFEKNISVRSVSLINLRVLLAGLTINLAVIILNMLFQQTDKWFLMLNLRFEEVSKIILLNTAVSVLPIVSIPIINAFYPRIIQSEELSDFPQSFFWSKVCVNMMFVLFFPIILCCVLLPENLLQLWLRNVSLAKDLKIYLPWMAVTSLCLSITLALNYILSAKRNLSKQLLLSCFLLVGGFLLMPSSFEKFGPLGPIVVFNFLSLLSLLTSYGFVFKSLRLIEHFNVIKGYLVLCAASAAPILIFWLFWDFSFYSYSMNLFVLFVDLILAYFLSFLVLGGHSSFKYTAKEI